MKRTKEEHIHFRILNSHQAFNDAQLLFNNNGSHRSCINRLYYSSFYIVNALLYKNDIIAKTHSGVKTKFYDAFVKTNQISKESAQLFSHLFDWRTQGDYIDFSDFDEETIRPLLDDVEKFNKEILALIENK